MIRMVRGARTRGVIIGALADWFAIRPSAASVLWTLYKAREPLDMGQIARRSKCACGSVQPYLTYLRQSVGAIASEREGETRTYELCAETRVEVTYALRILLADLNAELKGIPAIMDPLAA